MSKRGSSPATGSVAAPESVDLPAPEGYPPRKLAVLMFEYVRLRGHANAILGKYFSGYNAFAKTGHKDLFVPRMDAGDGRPVRPRSRIVSMFTEQVPDDDQSRDISEKHGVPIFRTVREALTLGTDELAVDGVLLIGEHGDFPINDKGQTLYPRFELFLKTTDVFRESGRSVPIFSDKHLSYSWVQARRMVAIAKELNFALMAGSSLPVTWRRPNAEVPWGARVDHAVGVGLGQLDSYGFHLLESLQCMVERRRGGETGVAAVQCLEHEAVWNYLDRTPWAKRLFDSAISHDETCEAGKLRDLAKEPAVFLIDYKDGLQTAAFMLPGAFPDFTVAVDVEECSEPISTLMFLPHAFPHIHYHFVCQVENVEKMFESGQPTYPVERTLLTSGILDFVLESRIQGHQKIETPQLSVQYQAPKESFFCTEGPAYLSNPKLVE